MAAQKRPRAASTSQGTSDRCTLASGKRVLIFRGAVSGRRGTASTRRSQPELARCSRTWLACTHGNAMVRQTLSIFCTASAPRRGRSLGALEFRCTAYHLWQTWPQHLARSCTSLRAVVAAEDATCVVLAPSRRGRQEDSPKVLTRCAWLQKTESRGWSRSNGSCAKRQS